MEASTLTGAAVDAQVQAYMENCGEEEIRSIMLYLFKSGKITWNFWKREPAISNPESLYADPQSETEKNANRLLKRLLERGTQTHTAILRHMHHLSADQIRQITDGLITAGRIIKTETRTAGRPKTTYAIAAS